MQNNVIHVGLDVDDSNYHGSAFNKATGEVIDFQCRPTLKGLLNQLAKLQKHFAEHVIKLCYEASYIGFTLQRDLAEKGFHCEVVAPNSIPRPQGQQIKPRFSISPQFLMEAIRSSD
jgi:transposase